ncbi:efflux RND transporter permease subunit [Halovulum sp. GXIMD14794]
MTDAAKRNGLAATFVARPILAVVLNLLVIIAGGAALMGVDVREMPNVDQPVVSVRTTYEGASPETVDTEITAVLEDALTALEGLQAISSTSSYGSSRITLELSDDVDIDTAANEAREIVSNQERQLPDDIDAPTVSKSDADADPIIRLALLGDATLEELTGIAEDTVSERLATIGGVAEVEVAGTQVNEFLVLVSMSALSGRGLTIDDLEDALGTLRDDTPLGELESETQSVVLRSSSPDIGAMDIANLRIDENTRVSDVAFVQLTAKERTIFSRVNGQSAVGLNIIRQSVGNTLSISLDVRAEVEEIQKDLPEGVQLLISSDDGVFIERSITEVTTSIGLAVLIVVAVIFLFLRSWRATLIPAITIPVSLIGTIAAIWLAGFSVNTITLLALVLATGMVVDDAIVVVENIVRRRQMGAGPRAAAVTGTNEVFFAVISTTATLAAVFVPISFLPGQAGGIFSEFGFVLAFCVTISSAVALTLVPMMAGLLDPGRPRGAGSAGEDRPSLVARAYLGTVGGALRMPLLAIGAAIAFGVLAAGSYQSLSSELTPSEDRGFFFIVARAPAGVSSSFTNAQAAKVEAALTPYRESGEVEAVQSLIGLGGSGQAVVIVRLSDWAERARSQQEILAEVNQRLSRISGLTVFARSGNSLGIRGAGRGLQFAVTGKDFETLVTQGDALVAALAQEPETFSNPQLSYDTNEPQIDVSIDTELATEMGLSPSALSATISAMTSGSVPVSVFVAGEEVDVRIEPSGPPIDDPGDLERVFARTSGGAFVPLSTVVSFEQTAAASRLSREGGDRAVSGQANLAEGIDLGTAADRLQELAREVLTDGTQLVLLGEAASLEDSQSGTPIVFAIAFIVVLLVLSAQFESLASAVVIMLTVPFGLGAALMAIQLTGGSLNYYSQIGLVMLIGIMAKNGILIVEFANQLRAEGRSVDEAIREAVRLRLRPVMMTMVSTVLGGLPLVMSSGAGAEAREAVGWVVVGGLGFATVFTLYLTPVFYRLIAPLGGIPGHAERRLRAELESAGDDLSAEPVR